MNDLGAKHPWLHQPRKPSSGVWYLRARVPKDVPNYPKAEVKRSLGTSNYREACRLIHPAAAKLEQEFDQYRRHGGPPPNPQPEKIGRIQRVAPIPANPIRYHGEGPPPPDLKSSEDLSDAEIRSFAAQDWRRWQNWIVAPLSTSDPYKIGEAIEVMESDRWENYGRPLQDVGSSFRVETAIFLEQRGYYFDLGGSKAIVLSDHLYRAGSEAYRRKIDRLRGVSTYEYRDRLFDDIPISADFNSEQTVLVPNSRTKSLKEIIDIYENDPDRRSIRQKTRVEDNRTFVYMKEFFGPDRLIDQIQRHDCIGFRDAIRSIPKHAYRDFKGLNLQELQKIATERSLPRLTNKGANKYIDKLSAVMNFAKERNFILSSPAVKIARRTKHTVDDRDIFSMETLEKIFSSQLYIDFKRFRFDPTDGAWFWVPLLSLFMGLRLGEACQLHVADVREEHGISAVRIEANELKTADKKLLKTASARRTVPCHPVILELGFLSLVDRARKDGNTRLFPNERRGQDDYFSPFSKRYSRFLSKIDCKTQKTSFHSFRHNFKGALDDAEVPQRISFALGGWSDGRETTGNQYGPQKTLFQLRDAITKISYPLFPIGLLLKEAERECL